MSENPYRSPSEYDPPRLRHYWLWQPLKALAWSLFKSTAIVAGGVALIVFFRVVLPLLLYREIPA